jgi:hypothetical protein
MKGAETEHWNEHEIRRAAHIFNQAEKKKGLFIRLLDEMVHWLAALVVLLGNLIIDIFIVFSSGMVQGMFFYSAIIILGIAFGWLIEMPLLQIEKLDKHKHFLSRIMLPLLALLNVYLLAGVMQMIEFLTESAFSINTTIVGIVYGISFLVPHVLFSLKKRQK